MRWVLLMALVYACGAASEAEIPYSELSALFALKAVLTLDPSGEVWSTWNGLPCDESAPWVGVECESTASTDSTVEMQKHVVTLDLPALGLESRALPEDLGALSKLRMLRLGRDWGNVFRGTVRYLRCGVRPALQSDTGGPCLTRVVIHTGALPSSLQLLTNLQYLLLGGNDITAIPSDWSALMQLRVVELSGNSRLAGTLPASLFDLPKLHTLRIQGTQMRGPLPPVGDAPLTELRLGHNELSGVLPSSLALLTGLTDLGLEGNQLHGPLPEGVFGAMPRLQELNLSSQFSQSGFTGTLPAALWTMSDLKVLDLHSNTLKGPLGIRDDGGGGDDGALQSLSVLNLASNSLTGPLPSHLASLPMLQYVYLNDNNLTGTSVLAFTVLPPHDACTSELRVS